MSIDTRGVEGNASGHKLGIEDPEKHVKMAIKQAAKGEFDEAIDALHELTRQRPDYLKAWTAKTVLYRLIGDEKMALLCARTARSIRVRQDTPQDSDLR